MVIRASQPNPAASGKQAARAARRERALARERLARPRSPRAGGSALGRSRLAMPKPPPLRSRECRDVEVRVRRRAAGAGRRAGRRRTAAACPAGPRARPSVSAWPLPRRGSRTTTRARGLGPLGRAVARAVVGDDHLRARGNALAAARTVSPIALPRRARRRGSSAAQPPGRRHGGLDRRQDGASSVLRPVRAAARARRAAARARGVRRIVSTSSTVERPCVAVGRDAVAVGVGLLDADDRNAGGGEPRVEARQESRRLTASAAPRCARRRRRRAAGCRPLALLDERRPDARPRAACRRRRRAPVPSARPRSRGSRPRTATPAARRSSFDPVGRSAPGARACDRQPSASVDRLPDAASDVAVRRPDEHDADPLARRAGLSMSAGYVALRRTPRARSAARPGGSASDEPLLRARSIRP